MISDVKKSVFMDAKIVGESYSKKAIDNIGKTNIAYLKDLGYSKETSEYFQKILSKSSSQKTEGMCMVFSTCQVSNIGF